MNYAMTDRVVVITGAGSGIGLASCRVVLEEGATVVAGDLDPSAAAALSDAVTPVSVDLSTPASAEQLISAAVEAHGRVDVLVNNVGVFPFRESFLTVSDADWDALMDVNFYSMVRACRAALPHMAEQGRGAIVSVASDVGRAPDRFLRRLQRVQGRGPDAVQGDQHRVRSERDPFQLRLAGPDPHAGVGQSGGFTDSLAEEYGLGKEQAVEHFAKDVRKLPLGKLGDPEDVARVIAFLASDVSKHVTGADYTVDGGIVAAA
jgi:NAD(P)-dependent dehydrogenase (short-subunit alcohol dehydrogenase family)